MTPLVVAGPLLLAALVLASRSPMVVVLPAYAATVPFGSLLSTGLAPPYDSVSTPLAMLLVLALVGRLVLGRSSQVRFSPTVSIWLLFLGVVGSTSFWSVSPQLTGTAFRNLGLLVVLYLLLALTPVDAPTLRRVETALVIGGLAAAAYGIFQFGTGTLPIDVEGGGAGRFGRDLLGANNTAAALIMPFAVALWRSAVRPTPAGRAAYSAAGGVLVFAILLTGSRGGILATIATLLVMTLSSRRARRAMLRQSAAALVILVAVVVVQPGGVASRTDSTKSSGRSDIWKVGIHACHTYCLAGSGWGTFSRVYQIELPKVPDTRIFGRGVAYEPHNIWLLLAVETGIAGLVLAFIGLALTMWDAWRLPASLRAPPLAGMAGTLVASFFLSNFEYKFFWMNLSYCLLCRTAAHSEGPAPAWLPPAAGSREHEIPTPAGAVVPVTTAPETT